MKIDIEGSDRACLMSLREVPDKPRFLSVECDPSNREETLAMLDLLSRYGYRRFKLLNQALNPSLRCPYPPLEGDYYAVTFDISSSGPFGEETPGEWMTLSEVRQRYLTVSQQQAIRAGYTATGRAFGIPLGRFHRQLHSIYNWRVVKQLRASYATIRKTEIGGWFDIHAAL